MSLNKIQFGIFKKNVKDLKDRNKEQYKMIYGYCPKCDWSPLPWGLIPIDKDGKYICPECNQPLTRP